MSRKKLRARDKVTLKNSRDGAIERNLASGEDIRVGKRTADFDLRGEQAERGTFSLPGKSAVSKTGKSRKYKRKQRHRQRQRHNRPAPADSSAAAAKADPQTVSETGGTPKQPETAVISPIRAMDAGREAVQDDTARLAADHRVAKTILTSGKSKPPKQSRPFAEPTKQNDADTPEPAPQPALKQGQSVSRDTLF